MGMIEHTFESESDSEFELERAVEAVRHAVRALEPARLAGSDAARLTAVAAEGERLLGAAKALLARRTDETRAWRGGRAASVEQWLAETSGCSEGAARESLATAQRVETLPETRDRLLDGRLSIGQAALVSAGAAVDPGAEAHLLRTATRSGMRGLRQEKERVVAAATDEEAASRRAQRERHLRTWANGPATHDTFSGPTEQVADLLAALEPLTRARFDESRRAGQQEPLDAYRFDALVALGRQEGAGQPRPAKHIARVRVDLTALVRGRTEPGEVCEIPGVGPVPVAHAREVLTHGLLQLVITDGVDVRTVVSTTRHVPPPLKIAIAERDRTCKVRGCDCDRMLHRHHTEDFIHSQRTIYAELGNLCTRHHHLVHDEGYRIIDHHDGTWDLAAPDRAPPGRAAA